MRSVAGRWQEANSLTHSPLARRGLVLVPVHVGVCCAGGLPAGRCRWLCVVFPVLGVCAATYRVHAMYFLLVFRLQWYSSCL